MIKFEEALEKVLSSTIETGVEYRELDNCLNKVLAEDIKADRDIPPFNKSAVDGYAISNLDSDGRYRILGCIQAGAKPEGKVGFGECYKVMTGAMVPKGASHIIMVEDTYDSEGYMHISQTRISSAMKSNVCYRGEDAIKGDTILKRGSLITPAHIANLASLGIFHVPVSMTPDIGIISTGNELVDPRANPEEFQIRDSNSWQLKAQLSKSGIKSMNFGIAKDRIEELTDAFTKACGECDIIILSGGVSMGEYDLVPEVIVSKGFEIIFDRISVQPGKPTTFAVKRDRENRVSKVAFALPGNPVSSLIQFELLVKPFIFKSMGGDYSPLKLTLPSSERYNRKNIDRVSFVPVKINKDGTFSFIKYNGSAHIASVVDGFTMASIPIGKMNIEENEKLEVYFFN